MIRPNASEQGGREGVGVASGPGCQPSASAPVCAGSSQSGIPNAEPWFACEVAAELTQHQRKLLQRTSTKWALQRIAPTKGCHPTTAAALERRDLVETRWQGRSPNRVRLARLTGKGVLVKDLLRMPEYRPSQTARDIYASVLRRRGWGPWGSAVSDPTDVILECDYYALEAIDIALASGIEGEAGDAEERLHPKDESPAPEGGDVQ